MPAACRARCRGALASGGLSQLEGGGKSARLDLPLVVIISLPFGHYRTIFDGRQEIEVRRVEQFHRRESEKKGSTLPDLAPHSFKIFAVVLDASAEAANLLMLRPPEN
jgi:hypothetical protein